MTVTQGIKQVVHSSTELTILVFHRILSFFSIPSIIYLAERDESLEIKYSDKMFDNEKILKKPSKLFIIVNKDPSNSISLMFGFSPMKERLKQIAVHKEEIPDLLRESNPLLDSLKNSSPHRSHKNSAKIRVISHIENLALNTNNPQIQENKENYSERALEFDNVPNGVCTDIDVINRLPSIPCVKFSISSLSSLSKPNTRISKRTGFITEVKLSSKAKVQETTKKERVSPLIPLTLDDMHYYQSVLKEKSRAEQVKDENQGVKMGSIIFSVNLDNQDLEEKKLNSVGSSNSSPISFESSKIHPKIDPEEINRVVVVERGYIVKRFTEDPEITRIINKYRNIGVKSPEVENLVSNSSSQTPNSISPTIEFLSSNNSKGNTISLSDNSHFTLKPIEDKPTQTKTLKGALLKKVCGFLEMMESHSRILSYNIKHVDNRFQETSSNQQTVFERQNNSPTLIYNPQLAQKSSFQQPPITRFVSSVNPIPFDKSLNFNSDPPLVESPKKRFDKYQIDAGTSLNRHTKPHYHHTSSDFRGPVRHYEYSTLSNRPSLISSFQENLSNFPPGHNLRLEDNHYGGRVRTQENLHSPLYLQGSFTTSHKNQYPASLQSKYKYN